jgi:hypothetical protein
MTDESRRRAIKRHLERHPNDDAAAALVAPPEASLRFDTQYAWVQWRDAVDDFISSHRAAAHV